MSIYLLPPSPPIAIPEVPFATWSGGFSDDDIKQIIEVCDKITLNKATVGGEGAVVDKIRKTKIGWIQLSPETDFIYSRLGDIANRLNGQFFDFDIWGFVEDLQYTVYEGTDEGHYTWHLDRGIGNDTSPRKLSLVLQLSDPSEYEGGDLEIMSEVEPTQVKKEKGLVAAFPSFMLHRVTPVTKGIRRTLVVWLSGPRFR
jgi:PKHD-type hydroxylase